jgi:hypothetical protein
MWYHRSTDGEEGNMVKLIYYGKIENPEFCLTHAHWNPTL